MRKISTNQIMLKFRTSAILFLFSAITLSGCGSNSSSEELPPASLIVDGVSETVPYIMTINDRQISLDEYRFFFYFTKERMDQGDETYWEQADSDQRQQELKDTTMQNLKITCAIEDMADQLSLTLTKSDHAQIDNDVKNQITALGGSKNYEDALQKRYLTDTLYRKIWEFNLRRQKLWSYYFDEGGQFYNSDDAVSSETKQTSYYALFNSMVSATCDDLDVRLQPEYDLISIDTLL